MLSSLAALLLVTTASASAVITSTQPHGKCSANQVFTTCGTACEPSCSNPSPQICTLQCIIGCQCASGYLRDNNKNCVLPSQCNSTSTETQCGTNEEWNPPGSQVERQCSAKPDFHSYSISTNGSCLCKEGYYRFNKKCILASECLKFYLNLATTIVSEKSEAIEKKCSNLTCSNGYCNIVNNVPTCINNNNTNPCKLANCADGIYCVQRTVPCLVPPCNTKYTKCISWTASLLCDMLDCADNSTTCIEDTYGIPKCYDMKTLLTTQGTMPVIPLLKTKTPVPSYILTTALPNKLNISVVPTKTVVTLASVTLRSPQCANITCTTGYECVTVTGIARCYPVCGTNEERKACGSQCESACSGGPNTCLTTCSPVTCQCKNGYYRLGSDCVPVSQCQNFYISLASTIISNKTISLLSLCDKVNCTNGNCHIGVSGKAECFNKNATACSTAQCGTGTVCVNRTIPCYAGKCSSQIAACTQSNKTNLCGILDCADRTKICQEDSFGIPKCLSANQTVITTTATPTIVSKLCALAKCSANSSCKLDKNLKATCVPIVVQAAVTSKPLNTTLTCSTVRCRENTVCEMSDIGVPQCVATADSSVVCPKNEETRACGDQCESKCDASVSSCLKRCQPDQCFCKDGFYRYNGKCISSKQCKAQYKVGNIFSWSDHDFYSYLKCLRTNCKLNESCYIGIDEKPFCVKANSSPCANVTCSTGQHCSYQTIQCLMPPCYNVLQCTASNTSSLCDVFQCPAKKMCQLDDKNVPRCVDDVLYYDEDELEPECGYNEEIGCEGCDATCKTRDPVCSKNCRRGCKCSRGFVRAKGKCVSHDHCPAVSTNNVTCSGAEEYTDCMPKCERTCRGIDSCSQTNGNKMCVSGCVCRDGYKRDANGSCQHVRKCFKTARCEVNEEWSKCMPMEEKCVLGGTTTNTTLTNNLNYTGTCYSGCACIDGFARHPNGTCISDDSCP